MAKTKVSEWSTTPSSNTDIDGINIAEGCAPSGINDAIRDMMAQIRSWQSGTYGDTFNGPVNGTVGATTPATGVFTTLSSTGNTTLGDASGDSITINGTATFANANPTLSAGTANGVTYLNGSKVLTSGSALTFDGANALSLGQGGTGATTAQLILNGSSATDYGSSIIGRKNGSGSWFIGDAGTALGGGATGTIFFNYGATSPWRWHLQDSGELMRLTSTGLGIGTSSPTRKLTVVSETAGLPTLGTGSGGLFLSSNNGLYGLFGGVNGSTGDTWLQAMRNDAATAYNIVLNPVGGNLGLGVTPSAWVSSAKALQIKNYAAFAQRDGSSDLILSWNATVSSGTSSGSGYVYRVTGDVASSYEQNGAHRWYTAPSGTAGNAITFTQAATLTADGNFLVGTTSTTGRITSVIGDGTAGSFTNSSASASYTLAVNNNAASGTRRYVNFAISGTSTGEIYSTGTTTVYGTTSDYRLKTLVGPVENAGQRIDALEPIEYEWKADGSRTRGFLAHKFQEVYPQSVTGEKDAVDADGNPVYQAMQASTAEVIADLVAEIQSLRKRLADAGL